MARFVILSVLVLCIGCASGAARFAGELPASRLSEMKRFYVQHQPRDSRNIHLAIREELQAFGFEVDAGRGEPAGEYDAIVTYVDRWATSRRPAGRGGLRWCERHRRDTPA
jgi:hypothetical protein